MLRVETTINDVDDFKTFHAPREQAGCDTNLAAHTSLRDAAGRGDVLVTMSSRRRTRHRLLPRRHDVSCGGLPPWLAPSAAPLPSCAPGRPFPANTPSRARRRRLHRRAVVSIPAAARPEHPGYRFETASAARSRSSHRQHAMSRMVNRRIPVPLPPPRHASDTRPPPTLRVRCARHSRTASARR